MEVDHITPKSKGGKNSLDNLQLLHRHCHDLKTIGDGSLVRGCTHDKGCPREELYEVETLMYSSEDEPLWRHNGLV
jgi:hypothetical protein